MLRALKTAVRTTSIRLLRRSPALCRAVAFLLPAVPSGAVAGRLYVWLAEARAAAGDAETALACCDRALARRPGLAVVRLCRGRLLARRGDRRAGADELRTALTLLPAAEAGTRAACHEDLGRWLADDGRPAEALTHLDAAVALRPQSADARLHRGECLLALGKIEQARADFMAALAARLDAGPLSFACGALGRALACEGRVEQAVAAYYISLAPSVPPTGRLRPVVQEPLDPVRLLQAYDVLAEDVVNRYGKLDVARRVYSAKHDLQMRLAASDPLGDLVLPDDWVRNIGHMGAIDCVLKLNILGWRSWRRILLLAPDGGTANRHYRSYFDGHVTTVTDAALCKALAPLATTFGFRVAHGLYPPGSDLLYFFEALGLIQQEWEAQGRVPLLTLTDSDKERGRAALERMGVPRDAWFVGLHVRESGFHEAGGCRHQAHRNADPLDYLPAIREITARGGWVVRMGDPSMTPLPEMERVVDYAHSPAKADWMDVFLCGGGRFFVGLASGLSQVAVSFGVPCVYVNWVSNVLPPFSAKDLFIPKLFQSAAEGKLLSFAEMFDPENLYKNANYYLIGGDDRRFLDSDPSDIRDCVGEMLDQLDGRCVYTPEDLRRRERLDAVMGRFGHRGYCRMGKAFLHKYSRLLIDAGQDGRADDVAARAAG